MSEKRADPETELEVNEAILEYIIYAAIVALLHDAKARAHGSPPKGMAVQTDLALQMVGCGYIFPTDDKETTHTSSFPAYLSG